jgi:hypothetical protein
MTEQLNTTAALVEMIEELGSGWDCPNRFEE